MTLFVASAIPGLKGLPETGDVLFTRGPGWASRVTVRWTGPASHQATAYNGVYLMEANAVSGRIEKVPWQVKFDRMAKASVEWILFHWLLPPMNPRLRCMIQCDLLEAMDFERYSHLELSLQGLDSLVNRVIRRRPRQGYDAIVFRRLGSIWGNGVICSKTSNRALIKGGFIPRDSGLEYGSPADTYRWIKTELGKPEPVVEILGNSPGWFQAHGA